MINNKDKILYEASKIISRKGYFGASLNEILNACQIPKGSFYYYFPHGKNEMTAEVVRYAYQTMEKGIKTSIFKDDQDALTVFTRMIHRLSQDLMKDDPYFQSLIITFIGIEAPYISEEVKQAAIEVYNKWVLLYEEKLVDCHYTPQQAKHLAPILCSLIHGTLIACWIKKNTQDFENVETLLPLLLKKENDHD